MKQKPENLSSTGEQINACMPHLRPIFSLTSSISLSILSSTSKKVQGILSLLPPTTGYFCIWSWLTTDVETLLLFHKIFVGALMANVSIINPPGIVKNYTMGTFVTHVMCKTRKWCHLLLLCWDIEREEIPTPLLIFAGAWVTPFSVIPTFPYRRPCSF